MLQTSLELSWHSSAKEYKLKREKTMNEKNKQTGSPYSVSTHRESEKSMDKNTTIACELSAFGIRHATLFKLDYSRINECSIYFVQLCFKWWFEWNDKMN